MDMHKWVAASRSELEKEDATRRLAWAREHEHLSAEDWLSWVWSDEMYVQRMAGASRGQTWVLLGVTYAVTYSSRLDLL